MIKGLKYNSIFIFLIAVIWTEIGWSQPQDNETKLAAHYFDKGEFEKAEIYYEKALRRYDAQLYFDRYFMCLFYQEKYDDCEKIAEKRIRKDPYTIENQFKLASVYKVTGRTDQAIDIYEQLIKDLPPIQARIDDLGELFTNEGLNEYALETYLKGRKLIKKGYGFQLELAGIYALLDRPSDMISEYLNLLNYSPVYERTVQTYLSRVVDFETDAAMVDLLRQEILAKIQKYPNEVVFNEMFIWFYLQKKEFVGAVIQAKALDKKLKENGKRLLDIGWVCESNKAYGDAAKAYQYVVDLGKDTPYYNRAMQSKLQVEFKAITEKKSFTKSEIEAVAADFESALADIGKNQMSFGLMEQLARIYAFYLDDPAKGLKLVDEALSFPSNRLRQAQFKVLKGDIHVISGDIWEASILYMQVENDFTEDVIGHEAKFKNAKVFYYDGEFEYAKLQLDVLKASTTKLIANDAMQLSLLLQDNLGVDTTLAPVQMFANADLMLAQHKYSQAIDVLDSLIIKFPFHSIIDEVLFKKAEVYVGLQEWDKAVQLYQEVLEGYGHDILGDDAAFRLAQIYDYTLENKAEAANYYKKILFDFKSSLYTAEARERFRAIDNTIN